MKPTLNRGEHTLLVRNPLIRAIYQGLAVCCIILGLIGALLPVMPTTVFLLMAVWLSMRSSPAINRWLLEHPRFGPSLKTYLEHRTISRKIFFRAVSILWAGIAVSVWWVAWVPLKIFLFIIAASVTIYLYSLMKRGLKN